MVRKVGCRHKLLPSPNQRHAVDGLLDSPQLHVPALALKRLCWRQRNRVLFLSPYVICIASLLNTFAVCFGDGVPDGAMYCYICNSDHDSSCNSPWEAFRTPPTTIIELYKNNTADFSAYSQYAVITSGKLTEPITDGAVCADVTATASDQQANILSAQCKSIQDTANCVQPQSVPIKPYRRCTVNKSYVFLADCKKMYGDTFVGECRKTIQTIKAAACNKSDAVVITTRGCGLTKLYDPRADYIQRVSKDTTYNRLIYTCKTDGCNSSTRSATISIWLLVILVAMVMPQTKATLRQIDCLFGFAV